MPMKSAPPKGSVKKADGPICLECWPDGWPPDAPTAGCSHGAWER